MLGSTRKFNFICILIVILGISSSSYSQTQIKKPLPPKPDVPKKKSDVPEVPLVDAVITFDHDIFDFGDVPAGTKVTHAFPVENRGVDTLNIVAIKAGWGCTTTKKSGIVIPPGEKSYIDITYRASGSTKQVGKATKRITIHSNDKNNPVTELRIQAQSNNPYIVLKTDPAAFDFGEVLLGSSPDKSIEIKNIETQMAELAVVSEPLEEYVASYDVMHSSLGAGQATTINIKLRDDIPPGEFSTSISIQVRDNPENRISIPIQGNVVEKLSVTGMK